MPCYDPDARDNSIYHSGYDAGLNHALATKCNERTRMLCEVLTMFESIGGLVEKLSPETIAWWTEHKAWDAKRLKEEQA
jgi:hypothetical protein